MNNKRERESVKSNEEDLNKELKPGIMFGILERKENGDLNITPDIPQHLLGTELQLKI